LRFFFFAAGLLVVIVVVAIIVQDRAAPLATAGDHRAVVVVVVVVAEARLRGRRRGRHLGLLLVGFQRRILGIQLGRGILVVRHRSGARVASGLDRSRGGDSRAPRLTRSLLRSADDPRTDPIRSSTHVSRSTRRDARRGRWRRSARGLPFRSRARCREV
jgi:hypothetical protein